MTKDDAAKLVAKPLFSPKLMALLGAQQFLKIVAA
jgi:hypothetical protein